VNRFSRRILAMLTTSVMHVGVHRNQTRAERERAGDPDAPVTRGQRILIVEDDADLRRMFRQTLTVHGFDVEDTGDGADALRRIEQRPPDLVVLELALPTLSGLAVREEMAAHPQTRHIPIVVVTGMTNLYHLHLPCVLHKPVSPESLLRAIRQCLNGNPSDVGP